MEAKGLVTRKRAVEDERNLMVTLTKDGEKLKEKAAAIPGKMAECLPLEPSEAGTLYRILYKLLK